MKDTPHGEVEALLVSNDLQISGQQLLQIYKDKWSIEINIRNKGGKVCIEESNGLDVKVNWRVESIKF